ncbi:nucleoside triphosphate pyrophosphatase [Prochlorococcus sp. MIT 1341]|uniref:nucleoside triphosphate pyrophosphatase n=1 Tax=Prochlorococcus sp. MIT 1341 TaxID=3096221 RepID=UPI002A76199C|nr:nucleoside triphosphate pyrophosphatase [Prochlorococcus sp. MIT 1341]
MLILASESIPRHKLLKASNIDHMIVKSGVNENNFHAEDPRELVIKLAKAKAKGAKKILDSSNEENFKPCIYNAILGCDSMFELNGRIYGKPKNEAEALKRWLGMSSNIGILHTGHALLLSKPRKGLDTNNKKLITGIVSTKIYFGEISKKEIVKYIKTGEPMNCAGGFAIEGEAGCFIKRIEGCYSNVIGLSLPWLRGNYIIHYD